MPTKSDVGFSFAFEGYDFEILSVDKHVIGKALVKKVRAGEKDTELLNDSPKHDKI